MDESVPKAGVPHYAGTNSYDDTDRLLFERFRRTQDPALRDFLVRKHENLSHYVAARFADRGEPLDDLVQVANMGLIKSVDRFEASRGCKFATYAVATIIGEIRRHFRDTTWHIKTPRTIKELNQRAARARDALAGRLGRSPTVDEVAEEIGATRELTLEALELSFAHAPYSLNTPALPSGASLNDLFGAEDSQIGAIVDYDDLGVAVSTLHDRELAVITDYYFNELTETQIAAKLRISQMHVSRLKKKALSKLKAIMSSSD